ncbi:amino acid adenylation domain-containing protein [Fusobacterium nucleatum]|uniref:amino acid adenylation domain-containing protein n=1 Tax=Fusobacterium nucleatum TaxID=851 RepID=UPI0030CECA80
MKKNNQKKYQLIERELLNLWNKAFKETITDKNEDFFSLGGDSLKMFKIISLINENYNIIISPQKFIEISSIKNMTDYIYKKSENANKQTDDVIFLEKKEEPILEEELTDVQKAYLTGRNKDFVLGNISTHMYYEIETKLDIKKLENSLNKVIEHQPMLRAVFSKEGKQKILNSVPKYLINIEDISMLSENEIKEKIKIERNRMSHFIFNPEKWPLFEFKAFKINEKIHYLFIGIDLLIADGSSIGILVNNILDEYNEKSSNISSNYTFLNYVKDMKAFQKNNIYMNSVNFWNKKSMSIFGPANIPLKKDVNKIEKPIFKRLAKKISQEQLLKLKQICRHKKISLSSLLLSIYSKVILKWSNQRKATINITVSNRYPFHKDVDKIIGDFTSVMLMDVEITKNGFWADTQKIQEDLLEALEHRHYDGVNVIREIAKRNEGGQQVLMPIVFTSMLFSMDGEKEGRFFDDLGEIKMGVSQTSQVYLDYQVMELNGKLSITWDYIEELFDEDIISTMFNQYIDLLESLPEEKELDLSNRDKEIIERYNRTEKDIPQFTIQELFKKTVHKYPKHIAVKAGNEEITYENLDKKSNQIARYLLSNGIKKGDAIGIVANRDIQTIINTIGILKVGASYVAVEPDYPKERIEYILKNSQSKLLLNGEINEISKYNDNEINEIPYSPMDIAYTIYTSGSTGKPKGVVITHDSVLNTIIDINEKFSITEKDRIIGLSSMCFDLSVYDIFGSLISGATLIQIPDIKDIKNIIKVLNEESITIWNSVPAIMDMTIDGVLTKNTLEMNYWDLEKDSEIEVNYSSTNNTTLRIIMLSGDWIPLQLPDKIKEYFKNAHTISLGGATEASIWSIYYPIDAIEKDWNSIPYGYALANQKFYVLDTSGEICPVGVEGELYIGGRGLALGYKNDVEKTKNSFIENKKLGHLYRTGDYGKLHKEGYIEFLGRKDQQVKINGHRIELGEIENQINQYPNISNSIVSNLEDENGRKYLCAYLIQDGEIDYKKLEENLKKQLPEYMIPKYYVKIEEFSLNANGKVNRKALPKPKIEKETFVEPRTELEKEIAEIWKEVLSIDKIGIYDNFLQLGGDSISMIKVISKLADKFGINITFKEFIVSNRIIEIEKLITFKLQTHDSCTIKYFKYKKSETDKKAIHHEFNLTDVQLAYLMGRNSDFELGGTSTHGYYEIETKLDIKKLENSLNKVIEHQPMLRAVFSKEGKQKILNSVPKYLINIEDISMLSENEIKEKIKIERNRMSHFIFNPEKWPLFEFKAFKINEKIHYLFIGIDLLIADGSSMRIFMNELWYYQNLSIYKTGENKKVDFNFRDYILAYENFKKSDIYKKDRDYWLSKVDSFPDAPSLPLKVSTRDIKNPHFKRYQYLVEEINWKKIKKLAQDRNITPSALLFSIYSKILAYWSNQNHIGLNVTVFTRYPFHKDVDKIIGDFTSVMLMDVEITKNGFWADTQKIQEDLLEALEHRHYDGVNVIREIAKRNEGAQQVLMPIVFTSMLFSMDGEKEGRFFDDLGEIKMGVSQTSQVYLDYQVMELNGKLSITWDYIEELFDEDIISTMFNQYIDLLESLPEEKELDLSNRDKEIIERYNRTEKDIPQFTIQELFKKTVHKYPKHIAVKAGNEEITYENLDKKSNQIARYLLSNGIKKGDAIGIIANRDIQTIINTIGILKVGASYVAVEPDYPKERIEYILKNSQSKLLLNSEINEISKYNDNEINEIPYSPMDIAYTIYTSGSTGKPKGVVITHDSVLNTIIDINEKFSITEKDRIIGLSSMCFDLSVYDIFGSLISGATLIQIPDIKDIKNIIKVLNEESITIWNSVPAIMDMIISNYNINNLNLKTILLSGDWIPLQLPDKIKEYFKNAHTISLGGATEASIWSIYYPIDAIEKDWNSIPYGYALANQKFYVLNTSGEICPVGVEGELYIGGRGLALGYKNDVEKTKNSFIENKKLGHLYRTGDYGKLHKEGYIEFLGRKDQQVKINGHRIELGEIENQINQYPNISNSIVSNLEDENGRKYLCAYLIQDGEIDYKKLEENLKKQLPEYMIPKYYVKIEEFPLNANGKVNRKALPKPKIEKETFVEPRTELEKEIAEIWKEVLSIDKIGIYDNFLQLGGDSISMIKVISKLADKFGINITFKDFMLNNKIFKLKKLIQYKDKNIDNKDIVYKQLNCSYLKKQDYFSLTDVQLAYLMGRNSDFELGGTSTHGYYEIETKLDIKKLENSLNKVIEHQPMLRAVFSKEGKQKILNSVPKYLINIEDISMLSENEIKEKIKIERNRMSHFIFNPEKWPLFEFKAFKISEKIHYLFMGIDLLIADGSSMEIFVNEWIASYKGKTLDLINFNFDDYVLAYENFKKSDIYKKDRDYWLSKVDSFPNAPSLPLKVSTKDIKNPHFKRYQYLVEEINWKKIKKLAQDRNITPSALLFSIYSKILAYWSNQNHIGLNVTVFTRYPFHKDVDKIIGDFTSVMLMDVEITKNGFWADTQKIQEDLLEALEHRHYDGVNVIREIAKRNEGGQQVLMPIVFTSMLFSMDGEKEGRFFDDLGEIKMGVSQTSQVYLDYQVMELNGKLSITWDYIEELFDEDIISTMFNQYIDLLESLPEEKELDLSNRDKEIIERYNRTEKDIPQFTIQELFKKTVHKYPKHIAVKAGNEEITYENLDKKSNQIARYLLSNGIKKGDAIGIVANRDIQTIINTIGILKVGASYVAVEPDYPKERIEYILKNSQSKLLLNGEINEISKYNDNEINEIPYSPMDIAYTIYTSGSTGKPKGVVITHDSVLNTIIDINEKFSITEKDRIIGLSSMCFDLSVYDIFGSLISGATLIQIPDIKDIKNIIKVLNEESITIWNSVPAIMDMTIDGVLTKNTLEMNYWDLEKDSEIEVNYSSTNNTTLRIIMLSGDWIPLQLPDKIKEYFKNAHTISLGGATEASIWSIYYPIDAIEKDWNSIPYGYALANQKFYVLNTSGEICPVGVEGELYIGGRGLALGYKNDVEKTKNSFIENKKLGHLYRTGDYGKLHKEGYIEFLGRKDQQVKINGHRIELGEIENQINQYPNISNSIVSNLEDENGRKYLCAYLIQDGEIDYKKLEENLKKQLPEYMIPKYYVKIEEFPLNANGKVNRKALPKPKIEKETFVEPRTELEKEIAEIWKEVLGIDKIGIYDNFFKVGGDSISAIKIYSKISKKYDISINDIFKYPTIAKITNINLKNKYISIYDKYWEKYRNNYFKLLNYDYKQDPNWNTYMDKVNNELNKINISSINYKNILLTGANGYLGIHILNELINKTDSKITLIIRGNNNIDFRNRLESSFNYYFNKSLKTYLNRIEILKGDISEKYFDLPKNIYDTLSHEIDCIIHCAAKVSHYGQYEEFQKNNIEGSKNIIEFSKINSEKKLNYISTTYIVNAINDNLLTEWEIPKSFSEENYYIKSKIEVENMIDIERKKGLDIDIFRVGNLTFNDDTCKFQRNKEENAFYTLLNTYLKLAIIPNINLEFLEFTNVNLAAEAIVKLMTNVHIKSQTYHITNGNKISVNELFSFFNKFKKIKKLDFLDYLNYLKNISTSKEVNIIMNHMYLLPWNINKISIVLSEYTEKILEKLDFKWNTIKNDLWVKKMIKAFFSEENFK